MNNSHLLSIIAGMLVIGLNSSDLPVSLSSLPSNTFNESISFRNNEESALTYEGDQFQVQKGQESHSPQIQGQEAAVESQMSAELRVEPSIYPNPNLGYFVVELPASLIKDKGTIQVLNRGGQVIYSSDYFPENGNKIIVDLGTKDPGMYFLAVNTLSDRVMSKFLIH
ncbi:MAG: T9SS type A sorting domain-containing protein [Bacteroidetes bacterium]|nr:T9SS type A sorting domain-containing protein [Bacteroidota bacterium]